MGKRQTPTRPRPGRRMDEQPIAASDARNRAIDMFFDSTLPDLENRISVLEQMVKAKSGKKGKK